MIDFYRESSDKQWLIEYDGGSFTNKDIYSQSINITEGINSGKQLMFGSVESGSFSCTVSNNGESLVGKEITVKLTCQGETMVVGKYKVTEDTLSANRESKKILAYDAMYEVFNSNVAEWYNTAFTSVGISIKYFRDSFFRYLGIEQVETDLINDSLLVGKTLAAESINGKTIITAICQINGCFGHINRDGKFEYVVLKPMQVGLYPRIGLYPNIGLRPRKSIVDYSIARKHCISATFEDYKTQLIDKVQIRQDPDDIGGIAGDGTNCFVIQDNFLCYGMTSEQMQNIASKILQQIGGIWYIPSTIDAVGNLNINVGDGIKVETKNGAIMTYVLSRTLTGGQSLKDKYTAEGSEYQEEKVDAVHDSILRLSGKTSRLTRTVDQLDIQMNDEKSGLQSQITQNAAAIRSVVTTSYAGNYVKKEMLEGRIISVPESESGFGVDVSYGNDIDLGLFNLGAGVDYEMRLIAKSEDVSFTTVVIYMYLLDENKNVISEIEVFPYRVGEGGSGHSGYVNVQTTGQYYVRISCEYNLIISDIMFVQGVAPLGWTPNRTDEYSQLNQTATEISAKVSKSGGDTSFSWELLSDRFELKSNNNTVFKCDSGGITVNGYITSGDFTTYKAEVKNLIADNIKAIKISADDITAGSITIGDGNITLGGNSDISAAFIKSGTMSADRIDANSLSAKVGSFGFIKSVTITASQITTALQNYGQGTITVGTVRAGTLSIYHKGAYKELVLTEGNLGGVYRYWVSWKK